MSVTSPNSVNLGGHPHQLNEAVAFDSFNQSAYIEPPKPSRIPETQESIINEDVVTNVTENSPLPANSGANNDTNQNQTIENASNSNMSSKVNSQVKGEKMKELLRDLRHDCVKIKSVPESFMKNRQKL